MSTDLSSATNLPYEMRPAEYQVNSFEVLEKICRENDVEVDDRNFRWLGIRTPEGELTNLGFLLSDENFHQLSIVEVNPENPKFLVGTHVCSGSVLSQVDDAVEFISTLYGKNLFALEEVYPLAAVREAVVNMFIHRDYESRVRPMIRIWPDRLEFINGTAGEVLDAEALKLGVSLSNNPHMANVFTKLHLSHTIGSGLMKIREAYANADVQPTAKALKNVFVLTLPNTKLDAPLHSDHRDNHQPMSLKVKEAMKLFSDSDELTRKEVDDALGVSQTRSSAIIRDLIAMDVIEKVGTGRNICYRRKN